MAEGEATAPSEEVPQIAFLVKSSNDTKYPVSMPGTATVADLKQKLSGSEFADTPADRQRLIFSGRVLKDTDTLAGAKIKEGHTVHLVKSAASNVRQNPVVQSSASASPAANVPTNIAAGTGHNPLAALTGARYAGFHGLPSLQSFGADGGMGPTGMNPDEIERMLDNPNFVQQMNEMMDNPAFQQMLLDNPMFRDNPMARQLVRDPNYRRLLLNPSLIRSNLRAQQQMERNMARTNFPAPGATDNTDQAPNQAQAGQGQDTITSNSSASPFGGLPFALPPNLGQPPANGNPFAALFGAPPSTDSTNTTRQTTTSSDSATNTATANPAASLFSPDFFRSMGGLGGEAQGTNTANNSQGAPNDMEFLAASMRLMQNPDFQAIERRMRADPNYNPMNPVGAGTGSGSGSGTGPGTSAGTGAGNPTEEQMAALLPFLQGGGDWMRQREPTQADTRPPEERWAEQLSQLNDMGFFEFDRNVEALRRSGGNVQGAVEYLLSNP